MPYFDGPSPAASIRKKRSGERRKERRQTPGGRDREMAKVFTFQHGAVMKISGLVLFQHWEKREEQEEEEEEGEEEEEEE